MKKLKDSTILIYTLIYVFFIIFMVNTALASVTFTQAKQEFAKIQNISGVHAVLRVDPSLIVNAYSTTNGIWITQGMLEFGTKPEIAWVLAHELTHFKYVDARNSPNKFYELRADKEGYYYCRKKYIKKQCLRFILHAKKVYGDEGKDGVHPSWSYRYKVLRGNNEYL